MRSTQNRPLLFLVFLFGVLCCAASSAVSLTDIYFQEVGEHEGLNNTAILDIAEDQQGILWIGTINGLFRYTGYPEDTRQYYPIVDAPRSIPSGWISKIHIDKAGRIWVGTEKGLAKYNPQTDDFDTVIFSDDVNQAHEITDIKEDDALGLLVSTNDQIYHISDAGTLVPLQADNLPSNITFIYPEATRIWIGSQNKNIAIVDRKTNTVYSLDKVNPWSFSIPEKSVSVMKVIDGHYWLGTGRGIRVYDNGGKLTNSIGEDVFSAAGRSTVSDIFSDDSLVWIATNRQGLALYDLSQERMIFSGSEQSELTGLNQQYTFSIFKDENGSIWVGTYNGLFLYQPELAISRTITNRKQFQATKSGNRIWAVAEDKDGSIWLATQDEGLGRLNKENGTVTHFLDDIAFSIWDIVIDDNGYFWLATSRGVRIYEYADNDFKYLTTLLENEFFDTLFFAEGQIWTRSAQKELLKLNTKLFNPNIPATFEQLVEIPNFKALSAQAWPLYLDHDGFLWFTTDNGITVYNAVTGKPLKHIGEKQGKPFKAVDVYYWRNFYWVTTRNNGILKLDANALSIKGEVNPTKNDGLTFSAVGVSDSIWFANRQGIYAVDLTTLQVREFFSKAKLEYNSFNEDAVLKTRSGNLIFAGEKGLNIFNNEYLSQNENTHTQTRKPVLFELKIFGRASNFSRRSDNDLADSSTNTQLLHTDKYSLRFDESRFSITFGLVNPLLAEEVKYQYRMIGQDDRWFPADSNRIAQFNNLPFGDYQFEVRAKEGDKAWSDSQTLALSIGRPPWLHTVALIFYGMVLFCVLIYLVRQYQLRKQSQRAIQESEERLKLTLWSSGDELWDWDVFRGQVFRANTWGTLDFPQDNIRTASAYDANIHPNDILRVQEALQSHLDGHSDFYELAYRAKTFNNAWIWILDRGKVVQRDHNQQPMRMTGTLKNIHHLKEAEEQLNLFKRSIENISEGVFITDTNFRFISVNNAYCSYTGETKIQALASYMYFNQYPDAFTEEIKKTLRTKGNWFGEVESVRINGERYEVELNIDAVHDEDGRISHFVGVFSDITSRKSTEKELLKLANTDPLTELPNRSFFQASHQNLVRKAVPHALLCLDMDNFKKINDSLGHQTGDVLIKQIAKRLQRITGTDATCYRLGGDEFSVLMENQADIHTITHYAQSILDNLARPFIINKQEFVLGASIGIAFYPEDGKTPQEMLKNADTAMYFAKNNGGNSYKFFSGEMNQNAVRQLQIENLIRQGIKDDLFTVFYQPKVDIASGKLVSMEALVRFEHPHKGIVSPGQFIPLAEQTGQIIEIGEQVLRKACADTKRWVNAGLFSGRVAVNISARQFELPDLDDRIDKVLREVGLSPLHLECEITEGTLMENPEQGMKMMERLRERGIHLALDDFGTGYSSLAYLKRFPLNTLKIDKAFIDDIAESSTDRHMTAAIINIAHNLGLKVVAEGVEEEKQLTILRRYECEMLQGYLYSKPLNAERFEKLLKENQKLHHLIGQKSPY